MVDPKQGTAGNGNHIDAADAGLRYVSDTRPGFTRRRAGRHFAYRDADGQPLRDRATLDRIRALAIPPAWTDVWICPHPNGHLQATGRDARGRKQYRYHPRWQEVRGAGKYDRLIAFGEKLPRLRRRLRRDLALRGFPREKVLAIVIALMAETLLRVGNDAYARENRSYGLTTLRDRHVKFTSGGRVRLRFRGKSGNEHDVQVDDARLARLVKRCRDLPGQALFQYRSDDNGLCPIDSGDVNDYLRDAMGEAFTAKDFRTWGGTLVAFRLLACTELPAGRNGAAPSERALTRCQNAVISEVAATLGNTAAVCRKSYIDPVVFEGWRDGRLQRAAAAVGSNGARGERQWERAALRYLKRARRAARRQA
jgi:DNA topoisomerase IB